MSIKRVKRDSKFDLICIHDDAVDAEKSDLKGYRKSLDTSLLKMKEGKKPTIFVVKTIAQLKRAEFDDEHVKIELPTEVDKLQDMANDIDKGTKGANRPKVTLERQSELVVKYFNECVVAIKQWDGDKYVEEKFADGSNPADEFPSRAVNDIGDQCMVMSQLGEPQKKA